MFHSTIARDTAKPADLIGPPDVFGLAAVILGFALLIRLGDFGNPIAGLDEQFYLLVGDRMWAGAWPYLDIWDRKPAGLFVLYALIAALPGNGVVAYQLAATLALAGTGAVAAGITRQVLPWPAACAVGLAVALYGILFGVGFGEAPIFYDLLTVIAGALVLGRVERPGTGFDRRSLAAMLLCGFALTLKTSAVFEACAFGLLLVHADWQEHGWGTVARRGAAYLAAGLAPTVIIALVYAAKGEFNAFWFANFQSVFLRSGGADVDSAGRAVALLLLLAPLLIPTLAELRHIPGPRRRVLAAWLVAGLLSFVAIGRCFEHYAIPLVTPLALTAAYGWRRRWVAWAMVGGAVLVGGMHARAGMAKTARDVADFAAVERAIPASVREQCLFVYEGPVLLYQRTGACLPGRYVFPGHFTEEVERYALERPSADILRDTLARRPAAIVMSTDSRGTAPLTANDRQLRATLVRDYRPVAKRGLRLYGTTRVTLLVWRRR